MEDKKINWWLKLGCFLTGWDKEILKNCSELSFKELKRVTSAMLVISLIWFFVFFKFAELYLNSNTLQSSIAGIIGIILVIQIERQIVLHIKENKMINLVRVLMALLMALIASTIFDQIIFKDDVEIKKEETIVLKIEKILPSKQKELNDQIAECKITLENKKKEYLNLTKDINKNPQIKSYTRVAETVRNPIEELDSLGQVIYKEEVKYATKFKQIPNPKIRDREIISKNIEMLSSKLDKYQERKITLREKLEKELKEKHGFLDELSIMVNEILLKNYIAGIFWIILFFLWF